MKEIKEEYKKMSAEEKEECWNILAGGIFLCLVSIAFGITAWVAAIKLCIWIWTC